MRIAVSTILVAFVLAALHGASSTNDASITITRTTYGFEPPTLTITPGTTVTFVNMTPRLSWPASDMHPRHTAYKEFDPERSLAPLSSWSFTFTRSGEWGFHDHLEAHMGGVIVVDEDGATTETLCDEDGGTACWTAMLFRSLQDDGLDAAFDTLLTLHATYPRFAKTCHDYAHDIGLKAYGLYGPEVELTPKAGYCNAGFFHGYMEGFVAEHPDPDDIIAFCDRVGREIGASFPLAEGQCVHGIGHGALENLVRDEPYLRRDIAKMLTRAMEVCDQTQTERDFQKRCSSGVYDVFRTWGEHAEPNDPTYQPENLFSWCRISEKEYIKEGCYHELGKRLMSIPNSEQVASVFDFKKHINPEDYDYYAPIAAHSFALNIGKRAVKEQTFEKVIAFCRAAPQELQTECIAGLFGGIMFAGEPGIEYQHAFEFCMSALLSDEEKRMCFKRYQEEVRITYATELADSACRRVPTTYRTKDCPSS